MINILSVGKPTDMIVKKKDTFFWIVFFLLTGIYFLLKYFCANVTEGIFASGRLDFLNHISGVEENRSLDFYAGHLHDRIIGPALQVISAFLLTGFSLKYLTNSRKLIFGLAIFVYLVITKWEALSFPCYGEAGSSPIAEAIWLFRNSFDYPSLLNQPNFNVGGPKVYMFSLYPSYVAVFLKIIPSIKAFYVIYHLNMFAFGSVVISLFREMLNPAFGKKVGILGAILFLVLPLFQAMVELVNMEMMCLFFVILSMYFLSLKRIIAASILAVLAALAKGPGGIATATCFFVGVILFLFDEEQRFKFRNIIFGLISFIIGASKLYLLRTYVNVEQTPDRTIRMLIGLPNIKGCNLILLFYSLVVIATVFVFIKELTFRKKERMLFFLRHYIVGVAFTVVTLWLVVYSNISVMGPRYKLIMSPFLLLCSIFCFMTFVKSKKLTEIALAVAIGMASLGSYGLYYKDKIKSSAYSFNNLERSLEYRNDLFLNMRLAKWIEDKYSAETIGAPFVIAQILAMPELGYVDEVLDVVIYGMHVFYGGIKNLGSIRSMELTKTLWVGFRSREVLPGIEYPIDSKSDVIVKKMEVGDKEIFLFRGGVGIEIMRQIFESRERKKIFTTPPVRIQTR